MNRPTRQQAVETMIRDGRTFYAHGWLLGTSGNLSVRLDPDTFVITASGRDKGRLGSDDFLERRISGEQPPLPAGVEPSAETSIHKVIYQRIDQAGAVYHVHEPYSAFCSERDWDRGHTAVSGAEMIKGLDIWEPDASVSIPIFANHFEVADVAADIDAHLADGPPEVAAVNIRSHGVYAWGADACEAKRHVETLAYLFRYSWELGR